MLTRIIKRDQGLISRAARCFAAQPPSLFDDLENHGYLPRYKPLPKLPKEFEAVNEILDQAPFYIKGKPTGLLAQNKMREVLKKEFPDFTKAVQKTDPNDQHLQAALFRDFGYLSAFYMLEGCHHAYLKTGDYGLAEGFLPRNLAVPMKTACDNLSYKKPILDFSHCYSMNNWKMVNDPSPSKKEYDNYDLIPDENAPISNLEVIRTFTGT